MKRIIFLFTLLVFQLGISQEFAVVGEKKKYGIIDKTGKEIIEPKFDHLGSFSDGVAAASSNKKWGFINSKGEWLIEPTYDRVKGFNSGIAVVLQNKERFYINKKGERHRAEDRAGAR